MKRGELVLIVYWIALAVIMAVYIWVAGVNFWTNVVLIALIILGMGFSIVMYSEGLFIGGEREGVKELGELVEELKSLREELRNVKESVDKILKMLEE